MTKAYSGMSRKPIKSLLLRGVNVTALVAGLAGAVKGAGSFQTLFYTDDEETKHSEAFLFVGGAKDDLSFNFSPDPEAGTFTLSETASAGNSEGGDGGGDGGY